MTSKHNIRSRLNDLVERDGSTGDVRDVELGVTAPYVTYEHDGDGVVFNVYEVEDDV